jgi:hypothetical protein
MTITDTRVEIRAADLIRARLHNRELDTEQARELARQILALGRTTGVRIETTCPTCRVTFGAECADALMASNSVLHWEATHECQP